MGNIKNSLATRSNGSGKNIADILDPNNAPDDKKARAFRRTMIFNSLNTGRCTTSEELEERWTALFEVCFKNNIVPTVEALAVSSGIDRRNLWEMERR